MPPRQPVVCAAVSACDHWGVRTLLAAGQLLVVESEDDAWIGTAEVVGDLLIIRSGFRGHPVLLPLEDVRRITPADECEDVE